jgi:hypothetical protein
MARVRNASCKEECRSIFTKCCFQNQYIANEKIPMQKVFFMIFTTSHPYAPLGVGKLMKLVFYTQILVCIIFQNKKH